MAKPKQIEIKKCKLTRRRVFATWMQGDAQLSLSENENPLPSMAKAMEKLALVFCAIWHLPPSYAESLRVMEFEIGSKGGARTVTLIARKSLDDASEDGKMVSPYRLLTQPTEEGAYSPPLEKRHAEAIEDAVDEFKKYVLGQRAQGTLPLDGDDEEDDDSEGGRQTDDPKQEALPGVAEASKARKPAKSRK